MSMIGSHSSWIAMGSRAGKRFAPLFRREFTANCPVVSATLLISGLGYYEAWINGRRVGDHVLDPAQTDYVKRVFYVSHDVSQMTRTGVNAIGVMLGTENRPQPSLLPAAGLSRRICQHDCFMAISHATRGKRASG